MAKLAAIALVLATLMVAGSAAETFGFSASRQLQQTFTCAQAPRMLAKGACDAIGTCVQKAAPALASAANRNLFTTVCGNCVTDLKKGCTTAIPASCNRGLSVPVIKNCLTNLAGH